MKIKKTKTNQTYSNRVLRAEFDNNWESTITPTSYIEYISLEDNAKVELLLSDNFSQIEGTLYHNEFDVSLFYK